MWRKGAKYVGYVALWVVIAVVVLWAEGRTNDHVDSTTISNLRVDVKHSNDHKLIDGRAMESWIANKGLSPIGTTLAKADIANLESVVSTHTAVAIANVYTTYDGEVAIEIAQHEPIARLRFDGYDNYVTADGQILRAAESYSVPVTVVTGGYKPLYGRNFAGNVRDVVADSLAKLDSYIAELESEKIPYYEKLQENSKELRLVLNQRIRKSLFMDDDAYQILRNDLKRRKSEARNRHRYRRQELEAGIVALERRQEDARRKKQLLQREADDFFAMVDFLNYVSRNRYWSAEIVQIMASGGRGKAIELSFVPRSGRFTVDLGTTEDTHRKLATLTRFYEKGLNNIGWDKYRNISLRYRGQVVCK
ncbi:MAG: hypothetical protein IKW52_04455 [Alistipes sp.]|nr:hypothetical protein [Alistipes sp.]